jgi:hypothetical protein
MVSEGKEVRAVWSWKESSRYGLRTGLMNDAVAQSTFELLVHLATVAAGLVLWKFSQSIIEFVRRFRFTETTARDPSRSQRAEYGFKLMAFIFVLVGGMNLIWTMFRMI